MEHVQDSLIQCVLRPTMDSSCTGTFRHACGHKADESLSEAWNFERGWSFWGDFCFPFWLMSPQTLSSKVLGIRLGRRHSREVLPVAGSGYSGGAGLQR